MQQRGTIPAYDFALPVVLLGKETEPHLSKANITITPLSKTKVLLFVDENIALEKHKHISLSFVKPADIAMLKNNQFKKKVGLHPEYPVPVHQQIDNVLIARLTDTVSINGVTLFEAELKTVAFKEAAAKTLNADALLEGAKAYYRASYHEKKSLKSMKNAPYHFNFKYKVCRHKDAGATYKELEKRFGVYHETVKDWYLLYKIFGKEGLTKKLADELGHKPFTPEQKRFFANQVINGEKSFRAIVRDERVSLSRLRNWVKKERRKLR